MINRYADKRIEKIWSDENKYQTWLEVEKAVVEGWSSLGVIPQSDFKKIEQYAALDVARMLELEEITKHDVVAFTRMISESLGEEKRWIHLGLTSTDIVDTAQNLLIKQSNSIICGELSELGKSILKHAEKYKNQLIMGRTHGVFGEPTSLGLKFLLWFEELGRHAKRFVDARSEIEITKISGSMGNYAHVEPEIDKHVAKKLGLGLDTINTQVTQRDRHANLIMVMANIATTLEKIALEIRLFQQSEIQELAEGFTAGQKGSSSMPHKKNPIGSENISGLARYIRSFVTMALENNLLWHERDISHSSNERIMFPDIYNALAFALKRMNNIISSLVVNKEQIEKHLNEVNEIYYSQRVLTHIIINTTYSREEIYDFIQDTTNIALQKKINFKQALIDNGVKKYISLKVLDSLFDINYFQRNVGKIFERKNTLWLKKII